MLAKSRFPISYGPGNPYVRLIPFMKHPDFAGDSLVRNLCYLTLDQFFGCSMSALALRSTSKTALEELLCASPADLVNRDIAEMNLVCAQGLPGAEDLDIPRYLDTLNGWAEISRRKIDRSLACYRLNPTYYGLPPETTESRFRMMKLITVMKQDFGVHYSPEHRSPERPLPPEQWVDKNAKLLLINGLLSEQHIGTCNSIPVLVVALGRRLGYPLKLGSNCRHVWARWDSPTDGERFNIEASNGGGMTERSDDEYKDFPPGGVDAIVLASGVVAKSFAPRDDLAFCLMSRAWILAGHHRESEALAFAYRACFLSPDDPTYARHAGRIVSNVIARADSLALAEGALPRRRQVQEYFSTHADGAMAVAVLAHLYETLGRVEQALEFYEHACATVPGDAGFRADLERYRHSLERGDGRERAEEMRLAALALAAQAIERRRKPRNNQPSDRIGASQDQLTFEIGVPHHV